MAATHIEAERKFEGGAAETRLDPDGLPGVAAVVPASDEELDAVYYDTPDLRLLAVGTTLRRRIGGHDAGWHLKRGLSGDRREEIQLPFGEHDAAPEELLLRVRATARGKPLVPVLRMHTLREREHLVDRHGVPVAEVAHDHVSGEILTAPAAHITPGAGTRVSGGRRPGVDVRRGDNSRGEAPGRIVSWFEVEVELDGAGPALLDAVERQLERSGWRRSTSPSKTARAFAVGRVARPDGRRPATRSRERDRRDRALPPGTAGAIVHGRLAEQVGALLAADPAVRLDEPEGVHDMRVAARRLRGLLRSYRRLFDRAVTDPVGVELKWLGRVLGDGRDHEMLAARLPSRAETLAESDELRGTTQAHGATGSHGTTTSGRDPAHAGRVASALADAGVRIRDAEADAHTRARAEALRALDSKRYFRLLDRLDALVAAPPLRARARGQAKPEFRRVVAREHRRLAKRVKRGQAAPPGDRRDRAMHEARKAAKRARYAAETAVPVAGHRSARYVKHTKRVQRLLGERQDAVVAVRALPRLAAEAHAAGADTFAYGLLYAAEREATRRADAHFPTAWARVKPPHQAKI